jgi:hypothetical protein
MQTPGSKLRSDPGERKFRFGGIVIAVSLATLGSLLIAPAAWGAPPANDPFSAPAALPANSLSETNLDATAEADEPAHAGQAANHSVWYSLTPITTSYYRVEVCPSASSPLGQLSLAVYTGAAVGSLSEVGSDTKSNSPGTCITRARVEFLAEAGTTYSIAVDTTHNPGGGFNLFSAALPAPSNDPFSAPAALPASSLSETTQYATTEAGEPAHAGQAAKHSVWYSLTPITTDYYRVEVCPSASSPLGQLSLAVYTGAAVGSLSEVGSDTKSNSPGTCITRARVEFLAEAGTTYSIAVDTTHSTGGGFNLFSATVPPPDQDGDGVADYLDQCPSVVGPPPSGCPPSPPAGPAPTPTAIPTGRRGAALKKCKKKSTKAARSKCRRRARRLPV